VVREKRNNHRGTESTEAEGEGKKQEGEERSMASKLAMARGQENPSPASRTRRPLPQGERQAEWSTDIEDGVGGTARIGIRQRRLGSSAKTRFGNEDSAMKEASGVAVLGDR